MTDLQGSDWQDRYERLAADVLEKYGTVHGILTDSDAPVTEAQRIELAANELRWAAQDLEARKIFDGTGLPHG